MKRAERRHRAKVKQAERWRNHRWLHSINPKDKSRYLGRLRKGHFGCGCHGCKPWKHGKESKYTISERKRLK